MARQRHPAARPPVLPHMGWNTVEAPRGLGAVRRPRPPRHPLLLRALLRRADLGDGQRRFTAHAPKLTWAEHGGRFLAAVENGPLSATQFHPEKSGGDAGAHLLENWVKGLS